MGIYNYIVKINQQRKRKVAVSITMNNGELIKYTYGELFDNAKVYAEQLEACGIKKGDRVIIAGENSPEWQMAFLAIMKIKATAVLIDASLGKDDLKKLIYKSDARGIYVSPSVKEKIGESAPFRVPVLSLSEGGRPYKDSYKVLSPFIEKTPDADTEVALIIYSSGTTRSAAGIMHTHEAMIKTIRMTAKENELTHHDRILSVLPNSHIYGMVTCLLGSMMLGASLHYVESINNENILRAFKGFKPTVFPCVPKVFELFEKQIVKKIESKEATKKLYNLFYPICIRLREQSGIRLGKLIFRSMHKGFGGRLSLMTSAGAPLDEKVAAFYYAMGFDLLITYGLTETNIPIIGNRGDHITLDSCGTPYPKMDVQLVHVDESGEGEIYVRSPYMMKGYFRDEEATLAAFEEGWFKTGDLARLDAQGNVKITGRSKENIVLATGKKVAPVDIENQYTAIPGIEELVISGVPISGEHDEVHAFVVKESEHIEEHHIIHALQERGAKLAQYMKIAKIHFMDEIPKTSLQKPKRYLLKKHALEVHENHHEVKSEVAIHAEGDSSYKEKDSIAIIEESIQSIILQLSSLDEKLVTRDAKLISQIGLDSLSSIETAIKIEEKYGVSVESLLKDDASIADLAQFIQEKENHCDTASSKEAETVVNEKKGWHYLIFKAHCLLAHLLYRVKTIHAEVLPENKGYIICANHVSNIDYLWITQSFNKERFLKFGCLAKKELFKNSFISNLLKDLCGMISVDRGAMNYDLMKICKKQLDEQWGLLIHPEGTRSHDGELGTFKKGAASIAKDANVPIIPAYIKGGHEIFPRGRKMPKLFNLDSKCRYEVEVIYGDPIDPAQYSSDELIEKVELAIRALMGEQENTLASDENDEKASSHECVEIIKEPIENNKEMVYQEEITLSELLECDYEIDLTKEFDVE